MHPPITLDAPVITGITPSSRSLSVAFTQVTGGLTITNYQYSTDNGATFRAFATPDVTSPLTINTLSSDGTTLLTNGVTYSVIIQAKTANGLGSVSNMVQGTTPSVTITQFTTVGSTTWTAPVNVTSVEYLVVGGGGGSGGGYDNAGGGGGGGGMVRTGTLSVTPGDVYNVTVGDGGARGVSDRDALPETNGSSGGNTVFDSITALGGGGGYASRKKPNTVPQPDDRAGGDSVSLSPTLTASTGGVGGFGGGGGGGGGGNTSNGSDGVSTTGGNGGNGFTSSISGSSATYGIGGRGANSGVINNAVAGDSNTGNGARAGGTQSSSSIVGAKGGSGIVILKYT